MPDAAEVCEVVITAPDEEWLVDFTRQLIERRLVAGGHHQPVRSVYIWQGAIHDQTECRVSLHTRVDHVPAIIAATERQHPYEVAGIVALPIIVASATYRQWILDATSPVNAEL